MYGVEGSSDTISKDMNSLLTSSTFKSDGEFAKIRELISLDPYRNYDNRNLNQNQQLPDGGVERKNSFTNLLNGNGCPDFLESSKVDSCDVVQCSLSSTGMNQEAEEEGAIRKQGLWPPSMYGNHPTLPLIINEGGRNHRNLETSSFMNSNLVRQNTSMSWFLSSSIAGSGKFLIRTTPPFQIK
ncbi:hypothetical protein L6452_36003 [Arctium lappa]|uniref:Uncharacterized protein n=1 Tax=Arctium lappa TaxID=4217 RepID=A0ACB8Y9H2_ARCLA|nr:hypothetical protein L6452_36003 [Arctium lappa]